MNALYQRLKELDSKSFEQLCFQLLRERHPTANIRPVEGASGDRSVDVFQGDLETGPAIWQSKSFPSGIKESQKSQIRESLKEAVKNWAPRRWILCISVDMDIRAHGWFLKLTRSYTAKTTLGLMQAGDIVNELVHRKSIRDAFFPGAIIEVSELRALVTRTADLSDMEQAALAQENAEQVIERLKRRDARFNYEVSISPDRPPQPGPSSGATFCLSVGSTRINAFPRDKEALQLDPPKMEVTLKGPGVTKFLDFQRTGRSQTFALGEVARLATNLPFFDSYGFEHGGTLTVGRSDSLRTKIVPVRLVFGAGLDQVIYEYVPFRCERVGTDEVEIVSEGGRPFTLRLIVFQRRAEAAFSERQLGFSVREADKYVRAIAALATGGLLEAFELESGTRIFSGRPEDALPSSPLRECAQFFAEATRLCEFFDVDLQLNRPVTEEDARGLDLLSAVMSGSASIGHIDATIGKSPQAENLLLRACEGEVADLMLEHQGLQISVLDSVVSTGPLSLLAKAHLQSPDETKQRWNSAELNAPVRVTWQPIGAVAITRIQAT
jgi:hypothetical protein